MYMRTRLVRAQAQANWATVFNVNLSPVHSTRRTHGELGALVRWTRTTIRFTDERTPSSTMIIMLWWPEGCVVDNAKVLWKIESNERMFACDIKSVSK